MYLLSVKILNSNNGNMDSLVNIPSFAIKLPSLKLVKAESAVFKTASVKNTDLKSPDKETFHFLIKKSRKKRMFSNLSSRHMLLDVVLTIMTLQCSVDVELRSKKV